MNKGKLVFFLQQMGQARGRWVFLFMAAYIVLFFAWSVGWAEAGSLRLAGCGALVFASVAVTSGLLFQTYRKVREDSLFWLLLFLGISSSAGGILLGGYYRIALQIDFPFLSWDNLFYVTSSLLTLAAYVSLLWQRRGACFCFKALFDITLLLVVVFAVSWDYIRMYFVFSNEQALTNMLFLAYPVMDLGLLFGIARFYLQFKRFNRPMLHCFLGSIIFFFIADTAFLYGSLMEVNSAGTWYHMLWGMANLLIALAVSFRQGEYAIGQEGNLEYNPDTMWLCLSYGVVAGLFLLLLVKLEEFVSVAVGLFICLLLISVRQVFSFLENKRLLQSLQQKNAELLTMAYTDHLTAMPNRFRFLEDIKVKQKPCVAIVNIENFRAINEFYGCQAGDKVLRDVAACILQEAGRCGYEVYRLSGDEYALLADSVEPNLFKRNILDMYDCIEQTKFSIHGQLHPVFVSIGLSFTAESPLEKAQMALRYARQRHLKVQVYGDDLPVKDSYHHNLYWVQEVQEAIEEDRILLYYQPILDLGTGRVTKYEALVRMLSRQGEIISPGCFLPVIKKTKIYPRLTEVILEKCFAYFQDKDVEFSINLSAADIADCKVTQRILRLLAGSGLAGRVTFEFVESEEFENPEELLRFITAVKRYHAKIAIDDFGSGYSNFAHIFTMGADYIKVDGSLVKEIADNPSVLAVVESIVYLARKLNIKVIAEFVCCETIYHTVKDMGLDEVQGYFIGEPKPHLLQT